MATQAELARSRSLLDSLESYFFPRIRKFLWLASGLLSAACFFGVASLWHFGPESA
jgi:hypothetical protein